MTTEELTLARILFKNKIYQADGDKFEDIFTQIKNYADPDFQQVKPWGNIGDRKNDGYCAPKRAFYQVYAPEEIRINYPAVVAKLNGDFSGLQKQWEVDEFYFVVNDKYYGLNADSLKSMKELIEANSLVAGGFVTAKDLELTLFSLPDDQIMTITGYLPDVNRITNLDYAILTEIVGYIMQLPISEQGGKIEFPDWNEKIRFNKLGPLTQRYLDIASQRINSLNNYLSNESFLADTLQEKLTGLYVQIRDAQPVEADEDNSGDYIFWELVKKCSPRNEAHFESAIITIIAKYFESCDVFEKPMI